jgi:hypothetical protein
MPPVEACDTKDNDCDGKVDEGDDGNPMVQGCFCGTVVGNSQCISGQWGPCSAGTPESAEICDDKDNDCDNQVDEGCDKDADDYCDANLKVEGNPSVCPKGGGDCNDSVQTANPAAQELCNGVDDNCNNQIDDGIAKETCGTGVCEHEVETCKNGQPVVCNPKEGATNEICDQKDNDCDGQVDEDVQNCCTPGQMAECSVNAGECTKGTWTCQASGNWGPCSGKMPEPEKCDKKDNDCNGQVDDGNPEGGDECGKEEGECTIGTLTCKSGELKCSGVEATTEICDGKDNDCDGKVDDGMQADEDESNDTCSTAKDLGQIPEALLDDPSKSITVSPNLYKDGGVDSDWYTILAKETSDWLPCGLSFDDGCYLFIATLGVPEGVDYDLCIAAQECEGEEFNECAADGGPGEQEQLMLGWKGIWAVFIGNDDKQMNVQVKGASNADQSCAPYTLTFEFYNECPKDGKCPWDEGYVP